MIKDKLKNIDKYLEIPVEIREYIKNISSGIDCGRHEINSDDYMNVECYNTKSPAEGLFESHKKFTDIQIILQGCERIDFTGIDDLTVKIEYNETKDIVFYEKSESSQLLLNEGEFAVFYPYEAHMPQLWAGSQSGAVKKAVVKIKV